MTPNVNMLVTQIAHRLRTPETGGTAVSTAWVIDKPVHFRADTWERLCKLTVAVNKRGLMTVKPAQLVSLMMELLMEEVDL